MYMKQKSWFESFICLYRIQHSAHFTLKYKFLIPNVAWAIFPIFNKTWLSKLRKQTVAHIIYS